MTIKAKTIKSEVVSIRIDGNVKMKLMKLAEDDRRSLADYIRIVLEDQAAKSKK